MTLSCLGLFLLLAFALSAQELQKMRALYLQAAGNEAACRNLLSAADPPATTADPVRTGYHGAASMIMAKYVINPFSKISWFRKGRRLLEDAVRADPSNAELRYLRFCVEMSCPHFLGYYGDIAADKAILLAFLSRSRDEQLKQMIRAAL